MSDLLYSEEDKANFDVWDKMNVAHSLTIHAPYPSTEEIDELYERKPISDKFTFERDKTAAQLKLGVEDSRNSISWITCCTSS